MANYYPKSKVEVNGFMARHYDTLINIASFGTYPSFLNKAIKLMGIKPDDRILDLGAGTGRNACLMAKYLNEKGEIIGVDISKEMISQFRNKCLDFPRVNIANKRIDKSLGYSNYFDKVFISFVFHGFPRYVQERIAKNAFDALKNEGNFFILDYNRFSFEKMPFLFRWIFKLVECPYAFDFIKMDCPKMLAEIGFKKFEEYLFFKGYIRLIRVEK